MSNLEDGFASISADDILWDLEVPVTVRFARKRMLLGEAADLRTGAVVSLDRSADDLVDLLVHETVIARGVVVNADGNCAIRVVDLARPKFRKEAPRTQQA